METPLVYHWIGYPREVIISVKADGQTCGDDQTRVQAATRQALSENSIKAASSSNEEPDIILIACTYQCWLDRHITYVYSVCQSCLLLVIQLHFIV